MNRRPLLSTGLSLAIGVLIAGIVACGGNMAQKATAPPMAPQSDSGAGAALPTGKHDPKIEELAAAIEKDMKSLNLPPPIAASTCVQAECAQPASVEPSTDPTCAHGDSETCKDTCTLADSICKNAEQICKIAKELGNDAWAFGKCDDGNTSCKAATARCCGCQ